MKTNNTKQNARRRDGFTLLEVLIASILIGIAIAALLAFNTAITDANAGGIELSTAEFLVEQIRELTATLPVDDLYDFNNQTFNPPIGVNSAPLDHFAGYSQQITVENVSAANLEAVVLTSDFVRITVRISLTGREITSSNWLRTRQ